MNADQCSTLLYGWRGEGRVLAGQNLPPLTFPRYEPLPRNPLPRGPPKDALVCRLPAAHPARHSSHREYPRALLNGGRTTFPRPPWNPPPASPETLLDTTVQGTSGVPSWQVLPCLGHPLSVWNRRYLRPVMVRSAFAQAPWRNGTSALCQLLNMEPPPGDCPRDLILLGEFGPGTQRGGLGRAHRDTHRHIRRAHLYV